MCTGMGNVDGYEASVDSPGLKWIPTEGAVYLEPPKLARILQFAAEQCAELNEIESIFLHFLTYGSKTYEAV